MSSNFSSTALKDLDIPKALFMREGNGEGRENISSLIEVFIVTQENNVVIAMKLTSI